MKKTIVIAGLAIAAALMAGGAFAGATSESFVAFLRTEESSFWQTAPGSSVTVPVEYPEGADAATLTVTGLGYEAEYDVTTDTFAFELPAATNPETEDVYTLALAFNDEAQTVRTAKVGLVAGLSLDAEGTTRVIAPKDSADWNTVSSGRAVLPIPYGTTSFTVNGEARDTGLDGAQGWYMLNGLKGRANELRLTVGEQEYMATLDGIVNGLIYFIH